MSRIQKDAEDVTHIPTANKQNNSTAFTGSVPDGNVSDRGGEEKIEDRTHGFSKTLAQIKNAKGESLGWNAALILRYLSAISRKYGRNIDGKRWVRVNLDHISKQYPYIGRSTVDDNIIRLEQFGCCEKQNGVAELKSRKNDRTRCYHIPKQWMDAAEEEPRYFRSSVAEHLSVPAAVIYHNFCHWIGECKEQKVEVRVKLAPATLVELLPFSESTIKRCLRTLEAEKYIQLVPGKICWYAERTQELRGPNPDDKGSKPDEKGPNPDEKGPNLDNYIDCSSIIDELKTDSKPKPAASVFEIPSDDKKANDDKIHLLHDGIAPCADGQDRKEMRHGKITSIGSESISKWPMVHSLEALHEINHQHSETVERLVMQSGASEKLPQTISDICAMTMATVAPAITDDLYENPDGDEIITTLLPYFHQFLDQTQITPDGGLFPILYYGSLECLVGAFLWPRDDRNSYSHPFLSMISVTYKLHLVLWKRAEQLREQAVKEEFDQWRHQYASVDAHKEKDAELSPAEKMRVFRNALNSRNQVGWITYEQKHETRLIKITKLGQQRIKKLFELNADLTPFDLLPIVDGCMNEYISRPVTQKFKRGVHWHARMGHKLHIFASYLETIVKQLGIKSPVKVYLSDAKIQDEEGVALAA